MNTTTVMKCLALYHSTILPDIQEIVKSYLFYDTRTAEYQHRQKLRQVLHLIDNAQSRKNGFNGQEENDTMVEHWIFCSEDFQLQAQTCKMCGNYSASDTMYIYGLADSMLCECVIYN